MLALSSGYFFHFLARSAAAVLTFKVLSLENSYLINCAYELEGLLGGAGMRKLPFLMMYLVRLRGVVVVKRKKLLLQIKRNILI